MVVTKALLPRSGKVPLIETSNFSPIDQYFVFLVIGEVAIYTTVFHWAKVIFKT